MEEQSIRQVLQTQMEHIRANLRTKPLQHSGQEEQFKEICPKCGGDGFVLAYIDKCGNEVYKPCECRNLKLMENKLQMASIPREFSGYTVDSFDLTLYKSADAQEKADMAKLLCTNYVKDFLNIRESGKGLYLYSRVKGSGKTRMAVSIANDIITGYRISAKFATTIQILDEIKKTWSDKPEGGSEQNLLQEIIDVPVLVLDDIGVEKMSPWVNEKFYSILNGRMIQKQITIFTSNCVIEQLAFDERIINRIQKMALPVPFPEESVRSVLASAENKNFYNSLLRR